MLREIKTDKPEMREFRCLLRLDKEDLIHGNLEFIQEMLWEQFEDDYIATLVIIRSNLDK